VAISKLKLTYGRTFNIFSIPEVVQPIRWTQILGDWKDATVLGLRTVLKF
jgi:hypothetical protein